MRIFTNNRNISTLDEIWFVQHLSVFTQGKKSKKQNILIKNNIPIIQSDRGGQITYHGLGQQIMYLLIDLKRKKINIRQFITIIENTVINTLAYFYISSHTQLHAPGVYVGLKKICSLGLCIRNGRSFHGLALNVKMDLSPFKFINPCGYSNMKMTQISELIPKINIEEIKLILVKKFIHLLDYKIAELCN